MSGMPPATADSNSRSTPAVDGGLEQLGAAVGQQLLVGGDHRLAGLQGVEDQGPGRLDPADDLDHHIDVGIDHHGHGVGRQGALGHRGVALPGPAPHRHGGQLQVEPGAGRDAVAVLDEQAHQRPADVAAAQQPDPQRRRLHAAKGSGGPRGRVPG